MVRFLRSLVLRSLALATIFATARAGVLVVGPGGFATIQSAIDAAQPGDTVLVRPGTYDESFTVNKAIHVLGVGSGLVPHR